MHDDAVILRRRSASSASRSGRCSVGVVHAEHVARACPADARARASASSASSVPRTSARCTARLTWSSKQTSRNGPNSVSTSMSPMISTDSSVRKRYSMRSAIVPIFSSWRRANFDQVVAARHRAVVVQDLDDDGRRLEAGEPREIAACFRVARAREHAAGLRHQREDVARLAQVARAAHRPRRRRGPCARGRAPRCRSSRPRPLRSRS